MSIGLSLIVVNIFGFVGTRRYSVVMLWIYLLIIALFTLIAFPFSILLMAAKDWLFRNLVEADPTDTDRYNDLIEKHSSRSGILLLFTVFEMIATCVTVWCFSSWITGREGQDDMMSLNSQRELNTMSRERRQSQMAEYRDKVTK